VSGHPPIRTGVPAYDAVYRHIRDLGDHMPPDTVHRNAMIWRGVQAAVEAMQATYTPPPPGSDRDALPEHLRGLIWPHMRPYLSTACETADACRLAAAEYPEYADELRAWETREHAACRVTRKQDMASCDCRCHTTPKETP